MVKSITVYIILSLFAAWLFYDRPAAAVIFLVFLPLYIKTVRKNIQKKEDGILSEEFIRSLISVSSSLSAGVSAENAFITAASDMEKLYGMRSPIVRELGIINSQVATGQRLEKALKDFAQRRHIDEISDFAVVFAAARQKGADFSSVISSCTRVMEERRTSEKEALVLIRSRQYEQRVMCMIPPGILVYLRLSSAGFVGVLYHNPAGIVIMSAALLTYVLAIFIAERIGDIKI